MTQSADALGRYMLERLPRDAWRSARDLAQATELSTRAVITCLQQAERRYEVERLVENGKLLWHLTPRGRAKVSERIERSEQARADAARLAERNEPTMNEVRRWALEVMNFRLPPRGLIPKVVMVAWNRTHPDRRIRIPGNYQRSNFSRRMTGNKK